MQERAKATDKVFYHYIT